MDGACGLRPVGRCDSRDVNHRSIFHPTFSGVHYVNCGSPAGGPALQEGLTRNDAGVMARAGEALTYGYTTAFLAGAGLLLIAAVVVITAVTTRRTQGAAAAGVVA